MHGCLEDLAKLAWMECTWRLASGGQNRRPKHKFATAERRPFPCAPLRCRAGAMPEVLVVEECDSLEGMCSVSVELSGCEGVPKRWFRLVRLEDGVATAATEADAESLGALLTPQTARAARSPALSVEEAPDSPEAERAQTTSRHTAPTKPGGPCDHCSTLGAPLSVGERQKHLACAALQTASLRSSRRAQSLRHSHSCCAGPPARLAHSSGAQASRQNGPGPALTPSYLRLAPRLAESPQWRRGPAAKPVLCNACGTRYRRTGVLLASSLPSPFPCASPRPAKKPRIVMDELHGLMVKC